MIPIREISSAQQESRPTLEDMDTLVVSLCSGAFVRLPPWFSVGGALEVARYKHAHHVLIEERGTITGLIDERTLSRAPAKDVLMRWSSPSFTRVAPELSWKQALALVRAGGHECLLVGTDSFLVGIVPRQALEDFERQA